MSDKDKLNSNLMEYKLHKNLSDNGMKCYYNQNGKMSMWIRVSQSKPQRDTKKIILPFILFSKEPYQKKQQ